MRTRSIRFACAALTALYPGLAWASGPAALGGKGGGRMTEIRLDTGKEYSTLVPPPSQPFRPAKAGAALPRAPLSANMDETATPLEITVEGGGRIQTS
jgi:hypothetical protein